MKQGKAEAKAYAREGEEAAMLTAEDTVRHAGDLTTSFLQSGISLEGGPTDVIARAFGRGRTDIGRIEANANARAKTVYSKARTQALDGLVSSAFGQSAMSGMGGIVNDFTGGFTSGFDNAATYQTGATPGMGSTWVAPWQAEAELPWRV